MGVRTEERRTGKIKGKILEALGKDILGQKKLERGESLARSLYKEIGGDKAFLFRDMFRELHGLYLLVEAILKSADDLDRIEYPDRRKDH